MTYALIDNATLTGVQRITGDVPSRTKDSVDTDIIATENLVQAILFYDKIIAIDNYIPKHKEDRIKAFPFIDFLNPESFNLNQINEQAHGEANKLEPEIRGGEFVNEDFQQFFQILKTHIICTWDISSSIYYLTLKGLAEQNSVEFEKYGKLASAIFTELSDIKEVGGSASSAVKLYDSRGNRITQGYHIPKAKWGNGETGGVTPAISAFVASLSWLANRTIFYSLTSKYLKADSFLYPIRQAYQQHYMNKTCKIGFDFTENLINHFSSSLSQDLVQIHNGGLASATAIDLPIFSAWLAKKTGNSSSIINAAIQIRDDKHIKEAREQIREVRRLFDESNISTANKAVKKIITDIKKTSDAIRVQYSVETRQGTPITRIVQVYNTYAAVNALPKIPSYNFTIKLPEFLHNLRRETGFSAVYRDISTDLTTIWSLGEAKDILGGNVIIDDRKSAYNPKSESPIYKYAHSQWKSPM